MAYCVKCGTQIAEQAPFCSQCGAQQKNAVAAQPVAAGGAPSSGLTENVAAFLSYLFLWLGGVIFLLVDKRPFVRFHAAQSLVTFLGLHIVHAVFRVFVGVHVLHGNWFALAPGFLLLRLLDLVGLVLWIVLMVKAYQGEWFKVPVVWELAEGISGPVPVNQR